MILLDALSLIYPAVAIPVTVATFCEGLVVLEEKNDICDIVNTILT